MKSKKRCLQEERGTVQNKAVTSTTAERKSWIGWTAVLVRCSVWTGDGSSLQNITGKWQCTE